jgi:hypothetical protein
MLSLSRRRFLEINLQGWMAMGFLPVWSADVASSVEQSVQPAFCTFEARRQWLLDTVAAEPLKYGYLTFYAAQACFLKGKIDAGRAIANASLAALPRARVRQVEMFNLWPALHCFLRWRQYIDPADEKILRDLLGGTTYYKDARTSNLSTLAKVIRYLGGAAWGEEAFTPAAAYRSHDPSAEKSIYDHLAAVCRTGYGEYASWPYFKFNLMPILSLAELSPDPEMRHRALMAFEAGLAQCVSTWLKGVWGLATSRSYPDMLSMDPWGSVATLWVYFGGMVTPRISAEAMMPAVMEYGLDPLIENAAADRDKAYTAHSHFWVPEQISYINRSYVLFSEAQFSARPRDFAQSYPYGVMWIEPDVKKNNFLWLTVPINDNKSGAANAISVSHPHGTLARAQSNIQHEDALLYVCDTTSATFKYALCYVPGGWLKIMNDAEKTGRIFIHYCSVLIAITSSQPFRWDPASGIRAPAAKPREGDSEFRIEGQRFAAAIETALPEEFPGLNPEQRLKSFRQAIEQKTKLVLEEGSDFKASYTTRTNVTIFRVFTGNAIIDGQPIDSETLPILQSPWINQLSRDANLSISDGKRTRIYDFKQWQVTTV